MSSRTTTFLSPRQPIFRALFRITPMPPLPRAPRCRRSVIWPKEPLSRQFHLYSPFRINFSIRHRFSNTPWTLSYILLVPLLCQPLSRLLLMTGSSKRPLIIVLPPYCLGICAIPPMVLNSTLGLPLRPCLLTERVAQPRVGKPGTCEKAWNIGSSPALLRSFQSSGFVSSTHMSSSWQAPE